MPMAMAPLPFVLRLGPSPASHGQTEAGRRPLEHTRLISIRQLAAAAEPARPLYISPPALNDEVVFVLAYPTDGKVGRPAFADVEVDATVAASPPTAIMNGQD